MSKAFNISSYDFCQIKKSKFEISKVYTTRLQIYRLFCKNSIPYDPLGPLGLFKEEYALFTTLPFKPLSSQ